MNNLSRPIAFAIVAAISLFPIVSHVWAIEPASEFLDGLRARGLHDIALDYLDQAESSKLVPVKFKQTLVYERGKTLMEGSRTQRDTALRSKMLGDAQKALNEFVTKNPQHPTSLNAKLELGNVIVERARMTSEKADKAGSRKPTVMKEARGLYGEASKVFGDQVEAIKKKLQGFPKVIDPREKDRIAQRDQYRASYLQAQLLRAALGEEIADTLPNKTPEFKKALTEASDHYGEIAEKYRRLMAGQYAALYQGRCLHKLKKYDDALTIFADLMEHPDEPAFRKLKTKTFQLALDCWLNLEQPGEIIEYAKPYIESVRPVEERDVDWLSLRTEYLRFLIDHSQAISGDKTKSRDVKSYRETARKLAVSLLRVPGEHQKAVRDLQTRIPGANSTADEDADDPKNFAQARDKGREAIGKFQQYSQLTRVLPARIAKSKDDQRKSEMEAELEKAKEEIPVMQERALKMFRLALQLADDDVGADDINLVRYFMTYLYYVQGQYREAGLMGEFLVEFYPDSSGVRQAAKIAMAAYVKIYSDGEVLRKENPDINLDFETQKVIDICNEIVKKWPGQAEAEDALATLIPFMIRAGKLDLAQQYLSNMPEDSKQRADAELKTGQAMWRSFLDRSRELREWQNGGGVPAGVDVAARQEELAQLKQRAEEILANGVNKLKEGGKNKSILVTAMLSLAQIYVDTEQAPKAIALLEDPTNGPLNLVRADDEVTQKAGFASETYKTALRAYIYSLGDADNPEEITQKAEGVMDDMNESIEQAARIQMFVSLARQLEDSMGNAPTPEAKAKLAGGFETFLGRVQDGSQEFPVLNWVAETYRAIGESYNQGGLPSPQGKPYYLKAVGTYEKTLKINGLPDKYKLQIQLKIARTYRSLQEYGDAMDMYESVLKANQMYVTIQIEAAKAFQEWGTKGSGTSEDKEERLNQAMRGAFKGKDNKMAMWGWNMLSRKTGNDEKYKETYHTARYALAQCLAAKAELLDRDGRKENLEKAARVIALTRQLHPDLGGPTWQAKYEELEKKIKARLGS